MNEATSTSESQRAVDAPRQKILAIASAGGHWQQLMMLRPALEKHEVYFATTLPGLAEEFGAAPSTVIPDCNRNKKLEAIASGIAVWKLVRKTRPTVVISTGALPGVIALACGRMFGARTIWVDSVANAEEMSLSGRLARRFADLWLTQWEAVAAASGAEYSGAVL